jgi:transcriptional regulator with XRE-family HTH domain
MVTQSEIARKLGCDISTVNKILNGRSNLSFGKQTVDQVFETARALGYDFSRIRFYHRRRAERCPTNAAGEIAIYFRKDGALFCKGRCILRNVSSVGAFVTAVELPDCQLTTEPFLVGIRPRIKWPRGLELRGHVIRFAFVDGALSLGVDFQQLSQAGAAVVRKAISRLEGMST